LIARGIKAIVTNRQKNQKILHGIKEGDWASYQAFTRYCPSNGKQNPIHSINKKVWGRIETTRIQIVNIFRCLPNAL